MIQIKILEFKRSNLTNFLASVDLHYTATAAPNFQRQVLKIAKQKVTGSSLVESKVYEDLATFKAEMLLHFKPLKSHTQLEIEMATLVHKKDETIDSLAKRALSIKIDNEHAYKAELAMMGADLDAVRLREVEQKAVNSFRNALPQGI